MKKISRILSLVLAVCLISACFTVNVMAASTARTVTLNVDKTEGLKAGDVVTVEVSLDNTNNLIAMEYKLIYDTDAFEVDMTEDAYQDYDWYTDVTALGDSRNKKFANYLGSPVYSPAWDWDNGKLATAGFEGELNYQWAGSSAVAAAKAETDKLIGKFYITVKDDAPNGTYTFSLTGATGDGGETQKAAMVCAPVTVTVGAAAPADPVDPSADAIVAGSTDGVAIINGDRAGKKYDNAFAVTASFSNADANAAAITAAGVLFIPAKVLNGAELTVDTAAAAKAEAPAALLGEGTLTLKAAIRSIPAALAGQNIDMVTRAYAITDGAPIYTAPETTTINFTKTAE